MNRLLLIIACLPFTYQLLAQPYGNEWIDYSQSYLTFEIHEEGIYRIDQPTLVSAGVPANIDPRNIQIFCREIEQQIYFQGENDGSLDPQDFIEFSATGNDGWLDTQMYSDPNHQPDRDHSLINDTIHYYITWNGQTNNARVMVQDTSGFSSYSSAPYIWKTSKQRFETDYNLGILYTQEDFALPDYEEGEGWYSTRFGLGTGSLERSVDLDCSNAATSGVPNAEVTAVSASVTNAQASFGSNNHHLQVRYGANANSLVADLEFSGYQLNRVDFSVSTSALSSGTFKVTHRVIDDLDVATDNHRLSMVQLRYPHAMDIGDMQDMRFEVPGNGFEDKYRVQLQNYPGSNPVIHVVRGDKYRINSFSSSQFLNFMVSNQGFGQGSQIEIIEEDDISFITSINAVNGTGQFTNHSALDLDSAFVIITHPLLMTSANEYALYRGSPSSGRDAVVVDVEELYHQYGGGIEKHPLAIRRFCDQILDSWSSPPAQLFLLGKSVYLDENANIQGSRFNSVAYEQNLVPSYGSPQSDDFFTAGLNNSTAFEPAIPTGRLSAMNNEEVEWYLQKVEEHESEEPEIWMKNVLHFGGGSNDFEQSLFASYLSDFEETIEDTCFGGNVSTFLKTTSLPIEVNESELINDIIAEGISLMTFFGHAGGSGFDVSIDDPENLDWGGYPMVLINSCFTGDIHQLGHFSTSEQYVILEDHGAIGFIAHVRSGVAGPLSVFSGEVYRQIGQKNYGMPIGYQLQQTKRELTPLTPTDLTAYDLNSMTLQGDPAVIVHSHEQPDLSVSIESVSFSPEEITAVVDSFEVHVVVENIGKATTLPFEVELIRNLPSGGDTVATQILEGLYFMDTVTFSFPVDFSTAFGLNIFDVSVDLPENVVDESIDLSNNTASGIELLITDGGVYPVLPAEYAVIPNQSVILKASTGNPFAAVKDYVFELDTTDLFNSPLLSTHQVSQSGGVLEWTANLTQPDSTVYYWRVAENDGDPSQWNWRESSFQYIADRTGWGQAHYFQFKRDRYTNVIYDRPERDFDFFSGIKNLSAEVQGNSFSAEYFIDFESQEYDGCQPIPSLHLAVIDSVTLEPLGTQYTSGGVVQNDGNEFGQANGDGVCRNRSENYFIFRQTNIASMQAMMDMIQNEVSDGDYILIYTWLYSTPWTWDPSLTTFFNDELGLPQLANLQDTVPFILAGIKGNPMSFEIVLGSDIDDAIELQYPMNATGNQGSITSTPIGPASEWGSLHWDTFSEDDLQTDSMTIDLIGVTAAGEEQEIAGAQFAQFVEDIPDLSAYVDAQEFPFLKLRASLHDNSQLTPAQLRRWHVLYDPVPEAALNSFIAHDFYADELGEGEETRLVTTIQNISETDMDSLLVHYWVKDANNVRHDIPYQRQAPLPAGAHLTDTVTFSTLGFSGVNSIWVEANPFVNSIQAYDQLEQSHFNNIGALKFEVLGDDINPVLDVTFDGIHILDGEIVSTEPEILIRLDDENRFLLMNDPADTTYFDVFLKQPNGLQEHIFFTNSLGEEQMMFIPADGQDNVCEILYSPKLLQDGGYELIVIATDKSGNQSGDLNYRIGFEVDHDASVTEVMNYPNPFSTSTRFVFTLTGTEVPDHFHIQIMTVSGRVVREIHKEELGALRIGRNITEFAWDGTDMFGDRLANGVYLYRVIVRNNGQDLELRQSGADQFFKRGFGKMYLMR